MGNRRQTFQIVGQPWRGTRRCSLTQHRTVMQIRWSLSPTPVCHVMMIRDVESSFETVCSICRTEFCWHCAIQCSGKFGWRSDASAHEPTCVEYWHCAPGVEPLYVQRRLEEEKFAEQSKLQLCLALAESLQWPSLLQEPPKRLADMVLLSSDNGVSHAWSMARRDLDGILSSWGECCFRYVLCVHTLISVTFLCLFGRGCQEFGSLLCCMQLVHSTMSFCVST